MEWRKAIIILIISFAILNSFLLIYWWYGTEPVGEFSLTQEQQDQISQRLKQKGVILDTQIPHEGEAQAFLEVAYQGVDETQVVEAFLGKDKNYQIEKLSGGKSYTWESKQLVIMDKGTVSFSDRQEKPYQAKLSRQAAQEKAESFLEKHGGLPPDAKLNSIICDPDNQGFLVSYVRVYDGFFIANSYIDLVVTPTGVRSYYKLWLNPVGFAGKRRPVISPLTAVLRVISEVEPQKGTRITQIEQGFYTKFYDAEKWQAAPVWKIQLDDQDLYYVNAYTGELEQ